MAFPINVIKFFGCLLVFELHQLIVCYDYDYHKTLLIGTVIT